jgi:hypothetical protein
LLRGRIYTTIDSRPVITRTAADVLVAVVADRVKHVPSGSAEEAVMAACTEQRIATTATE